MSHPLYNAEAIPTSTRRVTTVHVSPGNGGRAPRSALSATRRITYSEYIRSNEWRGTRQRYLTSKLFKGSCYRCAKPSASFDVHHRTYKRLGAEYLMDLVALCRPCHDVVHRLHKRHGGNLWRITQQSRRHVHAGCDWCRL